jgi:hypothetical protein
MWTLVHVIVGAYLLQHMYIHTRDHRCSPLYRVISIKRMQIWLPETIEFEHYCALSFGTSVSRL